MPATPRQTQTTAGIPLRTNPPDTPGRSPLTVVGRTRSRASVLVDNRRKYSRPSRNRLAITKWGQLFRCICTVGDTVSRRQYRPAHYTAVALIDSGRARPDAMSYRHHTHPTPPPTHHPTTLSNPFGSARGACEGHENWYSFYPLLSASGRPGAVSDTADRLPVTFWCRRNPWAFCTLIAGRRS
jgi:hypothetical protein